MALPRPLHVLVLLVPVLIAGACSTSGTPSPTASPPAPATAVPTKAACSNPLYPANRGSRWTYSMSGISTGTFTHTITEVRSTGFTSQDAFDSGIKRTGEWKCEAGALTALSPAECLSALLQGERVPAGYQTTGSTGITLPAIVRPRDSWSQEITVEGTQRIGKKDVPGKGKLSCSCTAGDSETVLVPAGSFDAVRIGCRANGTIALSVAAPGVPTEWASAVTMWYARGIGMVKMESEIYDIGHSTTELTSYSVP
jgi:hypothetical protein